MSQGGKLELTGQKFGRLTALFDSRRRLDRRVVWVCRCDCGNLKEVKSKYLIEGSVKSCGCLKKEYKHGCSYTELYSRWISMKFRCSSSGNKKYWKYYGKKGIKVCKEWKDDYLAFKKWALNNRYEDDLTLHRKDSSRDYEPSNCQWITNSKHAIETINDRVARSMPVHFTTA